MPVIRQQSRVTNQPIGVARIDTGSAQLWEQISNNAGRISQNAFQLISDRSNVEAIDMAEAAKREDIITLDKNGMPKALGILKGFNFKAQQEYKRVINKRFEQSIETEIYNQSKKLSINDDPFLPVNPAQFDEGMSKYIAGMMKNEPDTKYARFIQDVGQQQIARTKISLQDNWNTYQRKKIKSEEEVRSQFVKEQLFHLTQAGSWKDVRIGAEGETTLSETNSLLKKEIEHQTSLVNANIITAEEAQKTIDSYLKISADGALNHIGTKIKTKNDLTFLSAFLVSGDINHLNNLPKEFHEDAIYIYNNYITADNQAAVNKTWNAKSDDFSNVITADNEIFRREFENKRRNEIVSDSNKIYDMLNNFPLGFNELDEPIYGEITREGKNALYDTVNSRFMLFMNRIENERPRIGDSTADDQLQLTRRSIILPFINHYLVNNPNVETETLIYAISTRDANNLNQDGKDLVNFLTQSPAFTNEDAEWVNGKIRAGKDEALLRVKREENQLLLRDRTNELTNRAIKGELSPDEFHEHINIINSAIGNPSILLSGTEAINIASPLKIAYNKGLFNKYLPDATEEQLEDLSLFISGKGTSETIFGKYRKETLNEDGDIHLVPSRLEMLGNAMMAGVSANEIDSINKEVTTRLTRVKDKNNKDTEASSKIVHENTVTNGNGRYGNSNHRKAADRILAKKEISWRNPDSMNNPELLKLMSEVIPESLRVELLGIANGVSTNDPASMAMAFKWYTILNEKIDPATGRRINPLRTSEALGANQDIYAKLNAIHELSKFEGTKNILGIAQDLANEKNDDLFQNRLKNYFRDEDSKLDYNVSKKEIKKYLMDEFDLHEQIATELTSYAKYYLYVYPNTDNLEEVLTKVAEEIFLPTEYVFSPHSKIDEGFFSMHALEAVTGGNSEPAVTHINKELAKYGKYILGENAYLVPTKYAGTVGVRYDAYISEDGALIPLLVEKNGEAFLPAFEFNTGSENDIMQVLEEYSESGYNAQQAFQKAVADARAEMEARNKLAYKAGKIPGIVQNIKAGPRPNELTNPKAYKEWARKTTYERMRAMGMFEEERGDSLRYFDPQDKLPTESIKEHMKRTKQGLYKDTSDTTLADLAGDGLEYIFYSMFPKENEDDYVKADSKELKAITNITKNDFGVKAKIDGKDFFVFFNGPYAGKIFTKSKKRVPELEAIKLWEIFNNEGESKIDFIKRTAYDSPTISDMTGDALEGFYYSMFPMFPNDGESAIDFVRRTAK